MTPSLTVAQVHALDQPGFVAALSHLRGAAGIVEQAWEARPFARSTICMPRSSP
jgi:hypothetical protein